MRLQKILFAFLVIFLTASLSLAMEKKKKDIVDTAIDAGSFETLVMALDAADLVNTLKSEGPFTVFAPTDRAFAKLPAGTWADLLKPENKGKLQAILTYHVVATEVMAADVATLAKAKTVNGASITVSAGSDKIMIDNARIIQSDIACSNGVIHVIDTVMMP